MPILVFPSPPSLVPYRSLHIYHVCQVTRLCNEFKEYAQKSENKEINMINTLEDYRKMLVVSCPIKAVSKQEVMELNADMKVNIFFL